MSSKRQKCIDCNRREDGGISEKSEKWEIYYNKNSLDRIVTEIFKTLQLNIYSYIYKFKKKARQTIIKL